LLAKTIQDELVGGSDHSHTASKYGNEQLAGSVRKAWKRSRVTREEGFRKNIKKAGKLHSQLHAHERGRMS